MGEYNGQQPTTTKQQPIQHGLLQKPAQNSMMTTGAVMMMIMPAMTD